MTTTRMLELARIRLVVASPLFGDTPAVVRAWIGAERR
jgi:hypothetical protein